MAEAAVDTSKEMAEPVAGSENNCDGKNQLLKELPVEAMNHLFQGKRHLLVHDYSSAVCSLQEACELFVKFYGPMAYECGDIHYYYGKALLELAREETGVLGDAIEGGSEDGESKENSDEDGDKDGTEDSAEESKVDSEEAEEESLGSSEQGKTDSDDQSKNDGDSEKPNSTVVEAKGEDPKISTSESGDVEAKGDEPKISTSESCDVPQTSTSGPSTEPGPSGSSGPAVQKEEEITTLQLAWEVLEIAKVIYKKHSEDNREDQLKIAEILLALGEISLEEENFNQSIEDLQECLKIHMKYLDPDDRLLAQTYYQMGLAYTFANDYESALESYQKAIDVIEVRIGALKTQKSPENCSDFSHIDREKEIGDLESILPDIKAKMEDTLELKEEAKQALQQKMVVFKDEEDFGIPSKDSVTTAAKPVSNLTHLIKRKKPEEQDNTLQPAAKKLISNQEGSSETVSVMIHN